MRGRSIRAGLRPLMAALLASGAVVACSTLVGVGEVPTPEEDGGGSSGGASGGASDASASGSSSGSSSSTSSGSSASSSGSSSSSSGGGSSSSSSGSSSGSGGGTSGGPSSGSSSGGPGDSGACPASHFCATQSVTFCDDFDESASATQAWCGESWTSTLLSPSGSSVSIATGVSPATPSPPGSLATSAAGVTGGVSNAALAYDFTPPGTTPLSFDLKFALLLPSDCSIPSPTGRAWGAAAMHVSSNYALLVVVTPNGGVVLSQINSGTPNPTPTGLAVSAGTWTNVELSASFSSTTSGSATVTVGSSASSPVSLSLPSALSTSNWELDVGLSTPSGVTTSGCSADFDNLTLDVP